MERIARDGETLYASRLQRIRKSKLFSSLCDCHEREMKGLSSPFTKNESLAGKFRSEGLSKLTILEFVCLLKWKRRVSVEGPRRWCLECRTREALLVAGDPRARPFQSTLLREDSLPARCGDASLLRV